MFIMDFLIHILVSLNSTIFCYNFVKTIILLVLFYSDRHLQDYTLLYELAKTFGEDTNYEYFWFFQDSSLPHVFHLLHDLCELVTKLILNVLSEDVFPGESNAVILYVVHLNCSTMEERSL